MRKLNSILASLFLLLMCLGSNAQNISNKGTEFWVGYGHHQFMENGGNTQNMVLYLSAEEKIAHVTVTIDSASGPIPGTGWSRTYTVPAYSVISTNIIPKGADNAPTPADVNFDARLVKTPKPAGTGGEGLFNKRGIHIKSDVPIVAYAHIYGSVSSGATMLLPVNSWGYSYTSINSKQIRAGSGAYSWVYVIAKENNTVVRITPSEKTYLDKPKGVPFDVTLQKGHIYQVIGDADGNGTGPQLTGTTIKSIAGPDGICHPVAVFAGSSRTMGEDDPCGSGGGRDNDMQQMFPEQTWGKRYLTAPFALASGTSAANVTLKPTQFQTSVYKVIIKDVNTEVKVNGKILAKSTLINNRYYQFSSTTADLIEADKPVMVAQFMPSNSSGCAPSGNLGDPEIVILSPVEQAIKRVGYFRNTKEAIFANFVNIVIPTEGLKSLKIDGSLTAYKSSGYYAYAHPNLPGYSVVVKGWPAAQAQCILESDSSFNSVTYGLGGAESYAYSGGAYFNNLNAVSDIHNMPDTTNGGKSSNLYTCVNTPVQLSVLMRYQPLKQVWNLSSLGSAIKPNADVTLSPASQYYVEPVIVDGIQYYKYTLPGTYVFNTAGTHNIPIKSTSLTIDVCDNTEDLSISVEVKPVPNIDFNFSDAGCSQKDPIQFTGPTSAQQGTNSYTLNQWEWTYPSGTGHTRDISLELTAGTHDIKLKGVTTDGCVAEKTKSITVKPKLNAAFNVSSDTVCLGQNITISDASTNSGTTAINSWYWDLGNGQVINATNGNDIAVNYATAGSYTIKHVVKASGACESDTVKQTVVVTPNAVVDFAFPVGCLPASGEAQFSANATDAGGQAIVSYNWNFGDPNATAANPNTSTLQNPSHAYSAFGKYPVTLSVVTTTGCTGGITKDLEFYPKPVLTYSLLSPVCESDKPVSIAKASVTNNVPGTGHYEGPGTDASGLFNPAIAGPGPHKVSYIFTNTNGCADTAYQTITVNPKPVIAALDFDKVCLPTNGLAQFSHSSSIADGSSLTYAWNFGDTKATTTNPNTSDLQNPTHYYLVSGTYTINLKVTNAGGCAADSTFSATFNIKPEFSYTLLSSVATLCENVPGTVSVASARVTNGVTGTGIYSGPGTDDAGNFSPSVAGPGSHEIFYVFTTEGGCVEAVSQKITVKAKPVITALTFDKGCLPTNGLVQFSHTSSISDGQNLSYVWNFGDANASTSNPNTSNQHDPTHYYTKEGAYPVSLKVTAATGCVADSNFSATFSIKPDLRYPVLSSVCESVAGTVSVASATVINGLTGTGIYKGPGTDNAGNFSPSLAGAGSHTIAYEFTSAGGCVNSFPQTILVHAKPKLAFTVTPTGCLPESGRAQFTNASTIADGQSMTYAWDFGDANANASNPNTSSAANPVHNFNEGLYNIKLTATTSNGCVANSIVPQTFSVTPQLTFPLFAPVCESITAVVSIAKASVTNGVKGTGVYSGPGTDAAGNFNPSIAKAGTHTIWYEYTTNGGCKESKSQTIVVYPKPVANFTVTSDICLDGSATIRDQSTLSSGTIVRWNWNFGDGTPDVSYTNNSSFNKTYSADKTYSINLVAISDKSCVSDAVSKPVTVHPLPKADFELPVGVCMPNGNASFKNMSTVGDNSSLSYQWNFGDGSASVTSANPTHVYASAGAYNVQLTATSAYGCVNKKSKILSSFYNKPVASFKVAPEILCQGSDNVFTDLSTAPNSSIKAWNWVFNDGTTANTQNPVKRYSSAGNYDAALTVTNAVGCVSDPFTKRVKVFVQPVIDAGPSFVVPQGTRITFNPTVNDSTSVKFRWSPSVGFNPTILRPSFVANASLTYTLTATGEGNCTATDFLTVKILLPVKVPNAFSPNGDGINDTWEITNLFDYPGASVEVFNRYGQPVYRSAGYQNPWDGTKNGNPLPFGTYYYVIILNNGFKPLSGSITIIR